MPRVHLSSWLVRVYRDVFRFAEARRLWLAMLPVRLGYSMTSFAIVYLVHDRTGSWSDAGLATGAFIAGAGVTAPLRGSLVDKLGQTKPLLVYVPIFCAALVLLPNMDSRIGLILIAGLCGVFSPPLIASARPLWRIIVGDELVRTAYASDAVQMQLTLVVGPALTAVLATSVSPALPPYVIAALVLVGGLLFLSLETSRKWTSEPRLAHMQSALRAPGIRTMLVLACCFGAAFAALQIALPAKGKEAGSESAGGLLFAVLAAGMVAGGIWWGTRVHSGSPLRAAAVSVGSFALLMIPTAFIPFGPWLAPVLFAAGFALGPPMVLWMELIDRTAPPGTAVSAFTWLVAIESAGSAASLGFAGAIAEGVSATAAFVVPVLAAGLVPIVISVRRHSLRAGQWPASSQVEPTPTETSSGTLSS